MSNVQDIGKDLRFVRDAVARRERGGRHPVAIAYLWAIYVLIGYALLDCNQQAAGLFFAIAGFIGGIASWQIGKWHARKRGESDRASSRRAMAHFAGGIALAWIFCIALAAMIEPLRGPKGSQVFVVMIGLVYFLWGIHEDAYFLFLGPVLMLGGVLVGLMPHHGWTALGAVIALGLIVPTLLPSRRNPQPIPTQPA